MFAKQRGTHESSSHLLSKIKQFCSSYNGQLSTWCSTSHWHASTNALH